MIDKFQYGEISVQRKYDDKIFINHGYTSPATKRLQNALSVKGLSAQEKKQIKEQHKQFSLAEYNRIKDDYINNRCNGEEFMIQIASHCKEVIKACFDDSKFLSTMSLQYLRQLTMQCFAHEGHTVPKVRARMKTIVKFIPYWYFSDEILEEFAEDIDLKGKKEREDRLLQH